MSSAVSFTKVAMPLVHSSSFGTKVVSSKNACQYDKSQSQGGQAYLSVFVRNATKPRELALREIFSAGVMEVTVIVVNGVHQGDRNAIRNSLSVVVLVLPVWC